MKVTPDIYNVVVNAQSSWDIDEVKFLAEQERFKPLPFVKLRSFNPEEKHYQDLIEVKELVLCKDQIFELSLAGISFEIKQRISVDIDITQQLIALAEKPIKLLTGSAAGDTYNNKCEVHMPGHSLSTYNEMLLLEDSCTDELQASLNSGWRIVAACPQPDKRRPGYILGRFNPNLDAGGGAERSPD